VVKRAALLIALSLLSATSAEAANWKRAGAIADSGAFPLSVTVDRSGGAVIAWQDERGLLERARPRGGPFTSTNALAPIAREAPPVAGNASGEALQAWDEGAPGSADQLREVAALRPPSGEFAPPQTLYEAAAGERICQQASAISASGEALVVFAVSSIGARDQLACRVYAAVRAPGAALFADPVQLSDATARQLQVAFDKRGNGLVAWGDRLAHSIVVVRHPAGGGFEPTRTLGVPGELAVPGAGGPLKLQVSSDTGRAIIAFPTQGPRSFTIAAAIGDTQTGFGEAGRVSRSAASRFDLAAGPEGTLALAWRGPSGLRRAHVVRIEPGVKSMSKADRVTFPGRHAVEVALAINDHGRVTVAWARLIAHGHRRSVDTATAAPSRQFTRPQTLSYEGEHLFAGVKLATSSAGGQFLTWLEGKVGHQSVHWARAPADTGKFGRAHPLGRGEVGFGAELFRGARGAMLMVLEQPGAWRLFTYGEK
jgi:hypothetical protein